MSTSRSGALCPTCRTRVEEHPYDSRGVFCDLVLVRDRLKTDGSGDVVVVEVDVDDPFAPTQRTHGNNLRWIHRSRLRR